MALVQTQNGLGIGIVAGLGVIRLGEVRGDRLADRNADLKQLETS